MDVLLTFTGFHDPYFKGLVGDEEQPGPILSLLKVRSFDMVFLFSTPRTEKITRETQTAISEQYPETRIETLDISLDDPTDYLAILQGLRGHIGQIQEVLTDANFFVAVASGTPQMHACWFLLCAAGEIPARLLHIRPPHFVTKERPLITVIDLTANQFPIVRTQIGALEAPEESNFDLELVVRQLGIVGDHPKMRRALETAAMLAASEAPVLIYGETGTGKELFARLVHLLSGRPKERFIVMNCASIPENLVESILFGHKKGAFTGAGREHTGKFDAANKGTLFLDELGELPLLVQAKLLRVLQEGEVEPVGASRPHRVDVRIVAATNRDLRKMIRQGKFREDLYYRLNVGEVNIPPLRERHSDIPKLALYILDKINNSLRRPKKLSQDALARLQSHTWPGNVRDLENALERSVRLAKRDVLDADDLVISEPVTYADPLDALPEPFHGFSIEEFLASVRKQLILRALEAARGNKSEAARLLGISPQAVHKFVQTAGQNFNQD